MFSVLTLDPAIEIFINDVSVGLVSIREVKLTVRCNSTCACNLDLSN